MVDPIGLKPVSTSNTAGSVTRIAAVAPVTVLNGVTAQDRIAAPPGAVARDLAATAPIDHERVAAIRKALADGSFPIMPAQIADRLIAAKFEWTRNDG